MEELEEKVRRLEELVGRLTNQTKELGEAFNQNTSVYAEAFENTDARLAVQRRVINDINGGSYLTGSPLHQRDGQPDWEWYFGQYWACIGLAVFVAAAKAAIPEEVEDVRDDDFVFGGTPSPASVGLGP